MGACHSSADTVVESYSLPLEVTTIRSAEKTRKLYPSNSADSDENSPADNFILLLNSTEYAKGDKIFAIKESNEESARLSIPTKTRTLSSSTSRGNLSNNPASNLLFSPSSNQLTSPSHIDNALSPTAVPPTPTAAIQMVEQPLARSVPTINTNLDLSEHPLLPESPQLGWSLSAPVEHSLYYAADVARLAPRQRSISPFHRRKASGAHQPIFIRPNNQPHILAHLGLLDADIGAVFSASRNLPSDERIHLIHRKAQLKYGRSKTPRADSFAKPGPEILN
jgi:hypothetical protein